MSTLEQIFVEHALMWVERIPHPILTTPSGNRQCLNDCIGPWAKVLIRRIGDNDHAVARRIFVFQHMHLGEWDRRRKVPLVWIGNMAAS
jgi:hypothetical protein